MHHQKKAYGPSLNAFCLRLFAYAISKQFQQIPLNSTYALMFMLLMRDDMPNAHAYVEVTPVYNCI